jgi:hypothetical protein
MTSRLAVWLLCAGAIAMACGPRIHSANTPAAGVPAGAPSDTPPGANRVLASSLDVTIKDGVAMTLHVTNTGEQAVELRFDNGQRYDFVVLDSAGRNVWQWSADRMFTQALQTKLLSPKETLTFGDRWDPGSRQGRFTAVATLRSSTHPIEQRVEFTVP